MQKIKNLSILVFVRYKPIYSINIVHTYIKNQF